MALSCPTEGQLEALLSGTLPPKEVIVAEQHLIECAACRQVLNWLAGANESWLNGKQGSPLGAVDTPSLREAMNRLKSSDPSTACEKPGDMIGRYKLLQQIGEGGCGVVYLAEQDEPVRRRVALKVIKLGMDTRSVIARFEAERQALAMMDHPHIAKVYDAGATATGRPYFVMELVRGMKITAYCDEAKLSTQARLGLFIQVCSAIQHAHQKGIIHRDIKPSNILVTINDGAAVPKVIDFGIAKATSGQQLTDKTIFTAFEQFIGTPAYMSPEQAVITSVDIDTRSDIYALGVLLYELLTGKTPFNAEKLLAIDLSEMRRTIREEEPARPSTRLSTLPGQELSTTAKRRGLEAPKLISELRGDLDWVVMKCLEKDRARRYETANGLAMDLQRHLNNEPVVARPPSRLYRLRKAVCRNKIAFTAAASVVAALLGGLSASTWMFLKEREALTRAVAAEQAERKLRQEAELRELNTQAFQLTSQLLEPEAALSARKRTLEAQRKLLGNDHAEVAESLEELVKIYSRINDFPEAEKRAREALSIRRRNSPEGDLKLAQSLQKFSTILREQQRLPEAEQLYGHTASGAWDVGLGVGKMAEAEKLYREAVKIRSRIQGEDNVDTAIAIHDLAVVVGAQNRCAEALGLHKKALSTCRKLLPEGHAILALIGRNLLMELIDIGQLSQAAEFAQDFVPQNVKGQPNIIAQVSRLAFELFSQGRFQETDRLLNELVSRATNNITILRLRADYRARHARWNEAATDFKRVILLRAEDKHHILKYDSDYHKLATLLIQGGDVEGYREHCRKSVEQFGDTILVNPAHQISKACLTLPDSGVDLAIIGRLADASVAVGAWGSYSANKALAEYRQGRFASAVDWAEKTLAEATQPGWLTVEASVTLAMARQQLKQTELAEAALKRAEDDANKMLPKLDSTDVGPDWIDVIICDNLLREAKRLIEGDSQGMVDTE